MTDKENIAILNGKKIISHESKNLYIKAIKAKTEIEVVFDTELPDIYWNPSESNYDQEDFTPNF